MHDKVSGAESWWSGLVTEVFEALTPCRARKPALCGTARRCPMKGLQIRVWSWSWSSNSKSCAAVAVCAQLPQMIERSAFVRSRRYSSSSLEHDSPADSKIVAGAAILVENGPRATVVAFEHRAKLLGLSHRFFYKVKNVRRGEDECKARNWSELAMVPNWVLA